MKIVIIIIILQSHISFIKILKLFKISGFQTKMDEDLNIKKMIKLS